MRKIQNLRNRTLNGGSELAFSPWAKDFRNKFQTAYIRADIHKCKACWNCVDVCPEQVFGKMGFLWHKHVVIENHESCIGCKKCVKVCPHGVFTTIDKAK
ncbi:MAG: ferredoxin family protein [Bacteroidales bacterium]|nr:ferredoxin family protein [Bacteroidales bacterium]